MRLPRVEVPWVAATVIVMGLLRLALAARLPLGDDEAYYWLWSQHLAWSYPDHPPMIAAMIALSTRLFGDGVLGVRALNVVMASVTPLLVYAAGRSLFDARTAMRVTVLLMILPVFAIGTAFAFPDTPLMFFWTLGLWAGWRALQDGRWWWAAVGAAVGLALLSKLPALGLLFGLAVAWAWGPWRRTLRDPFFYAGIVLAGLLFAPVVLWNVQHDWLNITLDRRPLWAPRSVPENLLLFAAGQIAYHGFVTPVLIGAAIVAWRRSNDPAWRYLAFTSLPILIVIATAAVSGKPLPNWPSAAYLSAGLALGGLWSQWRRNHPRLLWASVGLTALTTAVVAVGLLLPWGTERAADLIGRWDRLAQAVGRLATAQPGPVLVLTDSYAAASQLTYRLRTSVPVTSFEGAFLLWQRRDEWAGWRAIYVDENGDGLPRVEVAKTCRALRPAGEVHLNSWRSMKLYTCDDVRIP